MPIDVKGLLEKEGALLYGKFFIPLQGVRVSNRYVNADPLYTRTRVLDVFGALLIEPFADVCKAIAVPAVGEIALLYACEKAMRKIAPHREVRTVWADKENRKFTLERMGFKNAVRGADVVVINDTCTSGGSLMSVCELVRHAGGNVIGASAIWNRDGLTAGDLKVPLFHSLVNERLPSWAPGEHPMWGTWPMVKNVGHAEHFPDYPHWINI